MPRCQYEKGGDREGKTSSPALPEEKEESVEYLETAEKSQHLQGIVTDV